MISGTTAKVKFKRLQRRLKLPHWQCMGLLEAIWELTGHSEPDGGLGRLSNEEIASFIQYDDDENQLIQALLETGWLDPFEHPDHPDVRFVVHDWADHCSNHIKGNFKKYGRAFLVPSTKSRDDDLDHVEQAPKGRSLGTLSGTVPRDAPMRRPTKPNQTKPNPPPPPTPSGFAEAAEAVSAAPVEAPEPEPRAAEPARDPDAEPLVVGRPLAWQAACDALVLAGMSRSGAERAVSTVSERGGSLVDVRAACAHVATGRFESPGGALDWWARSHRGGLDPRDPASWPKPRGKPAGATGAANPGLARQSVLHYAASEAKAGRVEQAIAALERAGIERNAWPAVVLHKLAAQPEGP